VAAVTACSTACTSLTPALLSAWVPILGIGFTAGCALFYGFDKSALLVMVFLATAAAAVLTIYIASLAVTLGSGQTPRG